ncbi:hypothetical protein, conserved [Trypanosoma brucei brucei TREU927]|uniref:Uncharacterized protein n=2 Tax=Trypanosoma brucei TaxID=5691 RepID=Q381N5_TRYB2|nr:hypothetical protein, conserved [Trypanosoma brucei brucei TREU927]EAN80496.1 hypothetical protein, conserved [Trypanosoma brucei brucei TREU927]6HIV_BM Chain BM, mL79 [Trypanosoma brucei brucei]6HIX_BM Chain BM, ml79 [Trypanosoma brucei brucei]
MRPTFPALGSRAKGYENRVMVYAHRRHRAWYLPPKLAHARSPLANKSPDEYGNTWDPRTGVEWYHRLRRRGAYRHWPWARWNDDPVRQHQELSCRRTFSAAVTGANEGVPLWNYYAEVGQEYGLPSHFPLSFMAPFIHQYTSRAWSRKEIERHLKVVEERTGLRTIQQACDATSELLEWGEEEMGVVPHGLLQHVVMLAEDIVLQNKKKAYRKAAHERGILRTTTMERYYALPHLRTGPPMPTTLEQPSGEFPWGKFSTMVGGTRIHPLYRPDGFFKDNMYPA